ncbi:MAG: 4-(cytidine 5'-diphospho)-2-C-methyl-D-erythritol kinase [Chitinophagaceae bacterium]
MVVFPNAKINLGLRILAKRNDGYHELETVFYPLPFYDALEMIRQPVGSELSFSSGGLSITGDATDNLCVKAYNLLKKDFPGILPFHMYLHKAIPSGAGLGGGSADASFTLKLLNDMAALGLSTQQLLQYSLRLGSDCPFFIINKPCFATGRGEQLETIDLDLSSYSIVIVNPGIHVPTGPAFSWLQPALPAVSLKEIITSPVDTWKETLINDFEVPVFTRYPEIKAIKKELYDNGAVYASMSGSGSTVYGIFPKKTTLHISFPEKYYVKHL